MPSRNDNQGTIRSISHIRQPNDQYEQSQVADSGKKQCRRGIGPAPGAAKTKQGPQQDPQIEPGNMNNVALLHIGQSAKMHPPHAAPVKTVGKAALHPLAPRPQKRLALFEFQPATVPVPASRASMSPFQRNRPLCAGSLIRLVQESGKSFSTFRL